MSQYRPKETVSQYMLIVPMGEQMSRQGSGKCLCGLRIVRGFCLPKISLILDDARLQPAVGCLNASTTRLSLGLISAGAIAIYRSPRSTARLSTAERAQRQPISEVRGVCATYDRGGKGSKGRGHVSDPPVDGARCAVAICQVVLILYVSGWCP